MEKMGGMIELKKREFRKMRITVERNIYSEKDEEIEKDRVKNEKERRGNESSAKPRLAGLFLSYQSRRKTFQIISARAGREREVVKKDIKISNMAWLTGRERQRVRTTNMDSKGKC